MFPAPSRDHFAASLLELGHSSQRTGVYIVPQHYCCLVIKYKVMMTSTDIQECMAVQAKTTLCSDSTTQKIHKPECVVKDIQAFNI